jgi:hypothetical protein
MGKDTDIIDRKEENNKILEYQKTNDMSILEEVYKKRIPTLKSWANKNFYQGLTYSEEDLFEEFSIVFIKAAETYDKKRGSFNTCLYKYLENRLKNIKSSNHAKKRVPEKYEGALSGIMLSLDYSYGDNGEGSNVTLKDIIPCGDRYDKEYILQNTYVDETLEILSENNKELKDFLVQVGQGHSLSSLVKMYKTKEGAIRISESQANEFSKNKSKTNICNLIKERKKIKSDFDLIEYQVKGSSRLEYKIELKKHEKIDSLIKSLKEIRKNKDEYKNKLNFYK